jgi:hypothetical protein
VLAAVAVGMQVGQKSTNMQDSDVGQARKAGRIMERAGFQLAPQTETVLVQSKRLTFKGFRLPLDRGRRRPDGKPFGTITTFARPSIPAAPT